MDQEKTPQTALLEQDFKSWFSSVIWNDPYPTEEEIARLAWEASHKVYVNKIPNE